ncbi:MAG: leucine-rich repeat protein [Lachnospiraceae bacterium]|nr:leucine-rich repeat protein [Lachnospiraceae bacterium]
MRRFRAVTLSLMLAATTAFGVVPPTALQAADTENAQEQEEREIFEVDGITYSVIPGTSNVEVGSGQKGMVDLSGDIAIPETVTDKGTTYTVTGVASRAFLDNVNVTSVKLPDTVTSIGSLSFGRATNLKNVNFPEGLKTIGRSAFMMSALSSAEIPGSVEVIGDTAFSSTSVNKVTLGDGVKKIDDKAFQGCENLTTITIPGSVESIGEDAFASSSVKTVKIEGDGLKNIGVRAFQWDSNLKKISLPASVEVIGDSAFSQCESLEETGLEEAGSHKNLKKIGPNAFLNTKITAITVPAGASFDVTAINNTKDLETINVEEGNADHKSVDGVLYSADGKVLERYPASKKGDYTTAEGTETIMGYAFAESQRLSKITMTEGLTTIENQAFQNSNVEEVNMGPSVKSVGKLAFQNCGNLVSVKLSDSLEDLGDYAFYRNSSLKELTLPSSLKKVGDSVVSGAESLEKVTITSSDLAISKDTFTGIDTASVKFDVETDAQQKALEDAGFAKENITSKHNDPIPAGTTFEVGGTTYKVLTSPNGGQNGTVQFGSGSYFSVADPGEAYEIPSEVTAESGIAKGKKFTVTAIGDQAYYMSFASVKEITIPDTVTTIGKDAFNGLSELKKIKLPANLKEIGANAFSGCSKLESFTQNSVTGATSNYMVKDGVLLTSNGETLVSYPASKKGDEYTVPAGVTNILEGAFDSAANLVELNTGADLITAGKKAFANMSSLKRVTMPSGKSLGDMLFYKDSNLKELTLPDNLKEVPAYLLYNSSGVSSLTIPRSVEKINKDAFSGSALEEITIESTKATAESIVIDGVVSSASYKVAAQSVKDKLIAKGVPAENITVDESLMKEAIKEKKFKKNGIQFEVTQDPEGETSGIVKVSGLDKEAAGAIVIPETVENNGYQYQVTELGQSAIFNQEGITSVTVPASVTKIGVNGINANPDLTEIKFAEGSKLTTVGNGAFADNHALKSIKIPKGVKEFGNYVLAWSYSLDDLSFEEGFTMDTVPVGFVFRASKLNNIDLPKEVTKVSDEAFFECASLEQMDLSKVTSIGRNAFQGCKSLKTLTLSDDLTSIDNGTFANCESLETVKLGKGLTSLGNPNDKTDAEDEHIGVFQGCTSLKSIEIPEGVTTIYENAFKDCASLKEIKLDAKEISDVAGHAFNGVPSDAQYTVQYQKIAKLLMEKAGIKKEQIKVVNVLLDSIAVTQVPEKLKYTAGEDLDLKGGVLTLNYDNGTSKTIDLTADEVKVEGYDANKVGEQKLTISYQDKTTDLVVTVERVQSQSKEIEDLVIKDSPIIRVEAGEPLTITGKTLVVKYADGTEKTKTLSNGDVQFYGFDTAKTGMQDVLMVYHGHCSIVKVHVMEANGTQSQEGTDSQNSTPNQGGTDSQILAPGQQVQVGGSTYLMTGDATAKVVSGKKSSKLVIPATIKVGDKKVKVTEVAAGAFKNHKEIKTLVIGKNVRKIGSNSFKGDKKIKKIVVKSKKIKKIAKTAFKKAGTKKTVVKVPKKMKKTYKRMFKKAGIRGKIR